MMTSHTSSHPDTSRRLLVAIALLITAPLLHAQGFTSTGGVTSTTDKVGVGVTTSLQGRLHVFSSTDDTILALYGNNNNALGVRFRDMQSLEGVCCGLRADFQGNSAIQVSNIRIGLVGNAIMTSLGGAPLRFNSVGVLGFSPGDVIVGDVGLGNGLRVYSSGNSSFSGNVGLGITDPTRPLSFANVVGEKLSLYSGSATPQDYYGFGIAGAELQYQVTAGAHHSFYIGTSEKVRIDASGNVGIGIFPPDARLAVAGSGHFTGNVTVDGIIYARYQDVAEWVPAEGALQAGTVVVLNRAKSNEVTPSIQAYDTAVAGVVSDQPGMLLGVAGENKAKIATTGRVKVRIDARTHAVNIGDLLVTSDVPGTAMRSEPIDVNGRKFHQPGTLIGKALEPLASGTGEILVLLSLQ
jgi:hypothetical protein